MRYSAFSDRLDGPHIPIRVQGKHAELAVEILDWFGGHMEGEEFPFDQEHDHTDVATAREAFAEAVDAQPWVTVPLTPMEHEAIQDAHVSYEIDGPGERGAEADTETWEEFDSELRWWYDSAAVDGDMSTEELIDNLAEVVEQYEEWELVDPEQTLPGITLDMSRNVGGAELSGSVYLNTPNDANEWVVSTYFERQIGGETTVDMDTEIGRHPHRHAVTYTVREFFTYAAENAAHYVSEVEEEPDGPNRDTTPKVEFGSREDAKEARERWSEYRCPIDDDKRYKTVAWVSDIPEDVLDEIEKFGGMTQGHREDGPGQIELTDAEKDRLGPFKGSNNYRKATAVKALLLDHGINDWGSFYDKELTVDEHRSQLSEWRQDQSGADVRDGASAEDRREDARKAEEAEAQECRHYEDVCSNGHPEACEFLQEECGYAGDEVEDLLGAGMVEDTVHVEDDTDQTEQQELVTVGGDEYPEMEVRPEVAGALGRSWTGYKGALGELSDAIETAEKAKANAQQAMSAINAIRSNHGQDEINPRGLEDRLDTLENLPDATTLRDFGATPSLPGGPNAEDTASEGDTGRDAPLATDAEQSREVRERIEDTDRTPEAPSDASVWHPVRDGYNVTGVNDAQIRLEKQGVGVYHISMKPPAGEKFIVARNLDYQETKRALNLLANYVTPADIAHGGARLYHRIKAAGVEPAEQIIPASLPRMNTEPKQSRDVRERIEGEGRDGSGPVGIDVPDIPENVAAGPISPEDQAGVGVDRPGTNRAKADFDRPNRMRRFSEMAAEDHGRRRATRLRHGDDPPAEDIRAMRQNIESSAAESSTRPVTLSDPEGDSVTVEVPDTVAGWQYDPDAPMLSGDLLWRDPSQSNHKLTITRTGGRSYLIEEKRHGTRMELDTVASVEEAVEQAAEHMANMAVSPDQGSTRTPPLDVGAEEFREARAAIAEHGPPEWSLENVADLALGSEDAARAAVHAFDSWSHFADHIDGHLARGRPLARFGSYVNGLGRTASKQLTAAMSADVARRVFLLAGMDDAAELHFGDPDPGEGQSTIEDAAEGGQPPVEADKQRTLGGDRTNSQMRFTGAESGEVESEVEATAEQNEGGMMADTREDPDTGSGETEQAIPDEFRVAEGGQETL